jgi:hypothetical protein
MGAYLQLRRAEGLEAFALDAEAVTVGKAASNSFGDQLGQDCLPAARSARAVSRRVVHPGSRLSERYVHQWGARRRGASAACWRRDPLGQDDAHLSA